MLRLQTDARSIVEPRTAASGLLRWTLRPSRHRIGPIRFPVIRRPRSNAVARRCLQRPYRRVSPTMLAGAGDHRASLAIFSTAKRSYGLCPIVSSVVRQELLSYLIDLPGLFWAKPISWPKRSGSTPRQTPAQSMPKAERRSPRNGCLSSLGSDAHSDCGATVDFG